MDLITTNDLTVIELIQYMLAPAVMISACGLLLLGINNKYSLVVNRIRLLNEERRKITKKAGNEKFEVEDNVRLESITRQLDRLVFRVKLVRNAVLAYTTAIGFFILTSFFIGIEFFTKAVDLDVLILIGFLFGMIAVFAGILYALFETRKGYEIVRFEVEADE